jgi:hypothetical protein
LTNENEIFNDNHYEIDALVIPLLAVLGRERYINLKRIEIAELIQKAILLI